MRWGWLIGTVLLLAAAGSVYVALQSPTFVSGLLVLAAGAAWKAIAPKITKPLSAEDTKAKNDAYRRGQGDEWLRKRQGSLEE